MKNEALIIFSQSRSDGNIAEQLTLPRVSPQKRNEEYPLKLELLPDNLQWWNEPRYWLIHEASNLRVPGSWSLKEAKELQDLSKNFNWNLDKERRVDCGLQLIALAEAICKKSSLRKSGGAA
jgi:hypothetical protein